ncbi:Satratoxin biosynthesis SC1 cluster protein 4 [Fusarium oxysporum f. sp. rapae]|uniref:Satratoxin biosynthesis SC1 cluster protein 4 n=1 Tax=Fusarium oxysporum f. sp. rapae TaxID=485398 RepID=A0A8J5UBI1_FUSOX|nr:Satratoxin biosynthesis SC1 cluster protein 4 [Fusarium oxysporum f. sp. rapae]
MAAVVNGVPVAIPPPEGYKVDFDNPQRNSVTEAYWLYGVGNFLTVLFIAQRIYVFSVVLQTLILRDFIRGIMGTHGWEMPITKFALFARALYLLPILYNPVQCGAKMALLLVYRRLAPQKWFHFTIWATSVVVIGSSIAITFTTIFPCKPVRAGWDITITDKKCIDRPAVYQATAIMGAITDAMVLAVPIPVVIPLQISRRQKIGLICFFGVGGVTVFTSIMRLIALIRSMGNVDQSWGGGPVLLWIFAEANLSIICATLTTVKPFIKHISPRILGSSYGASKAGMSNPSAPPTIGAISTGGMPRHDHYERFDDGPMYPLQTVTKAEESKGHENKNGESRSVTRPMSGDSQGDSDSEKAILQTRTTTMTYS